MADNKKIAADVLAAVGGRDNVSMVTHCMTRLRFNLKDTSIPKEDELKKIHGVLGVVVTGGQYQIIIGQNVSKVYKEICQQGGLETQAAIDENLDKPKEKLTPKRVGAAVLNYLAGSMTPLIPLMMAAGMVKTILVVCEMLGVLSAGSDLYTLMDFVYNAGFYFMPVYVGYHAAKKIGMTPVLGMYLGGILIAPAFMQMAADGTPFTFAGLPVTVQNYSSSVLPVIVTVAVAFVIEKAVKKVTPDALSTIMIPTFTIVFATPLALLFTAPAGSVIGDYLGILLNFVGEYGGFVGIAIIAAVWEYLVMTGMHGVLIIPAMMAMMEGGSDSATFVAAKCATFAAMGMALGTALAMKNKEEKSEAAAFFVSAFVGGVTEPVLYGIGLKYKRPFIAMSIGAALGGIYNGLFHVTVNIVSASNFLNVLAFSGTTSANFINGTIGCAIAFVAAATLTYVFGFSKEERLTGIPRKM